jgi:DNA-binding transcriptional LysR family regulator
LVCIRRIDVAHMKRERECALHRSGAMFNLRNLDLNLLTVFEAVYDAGSASGGAQRLSPSQSATSHCLARLRQACGDELFVRARRGLTPTPVAKEMYPPIKQALTALRVSLAEASGFDRRTSRRHFRVSMPHPLGPFFALELQAAALAVAPEVVLRFDTVTLPLHLEDDLRDGVVDIAIDWLAAESEQFINRKLFDDRLVLLARRDHPIVSAGSTLANLRGAQFVGEHPRRELERLPKAISAFLGLG